MHLTFAILFLHHFTFLGYQENERVLDVSKDLYIAGL